MANTRTADQTDLFRFLRVAEVIRLTALSRSQIWKLEKAGQFPRRRLLSAGCVGWRSDDIARWLAERPVASEVA